MPTPVALRLLIEADAKNVKGLDKSLVELTKNVENLSASLSLIEKARLDVRLAGTEAKAKGLNIELRRTSYAIQQGFGALFPATIKNFENNVNKVGLTLARQVFKPTDSFFAKLRRESANIPTLTARKVLQPADVLARRDEVANEIAAKLKRDKDTKTTDPTGRRIIQQILTGSARFESSGLVAGEASSALDASKKILAVTDSLARLRTELKPVAVGLLNTAKAALLAAGKEGVGGILGLGAKLGLLGAAALGASVALAAGVVALSAFTRRITDLGHVLTTILGVQEEIIGISVDGTIQDAKTRIAQAVADNKRVQILRDNTVRLMQESGGVGNTRFLGQVLPAEFGGSFRQLTESYDKYNDQIVANNAIVVQLSNAIMDGTIATNDAINSELKLAEARAKNIQKQVGKDLERAQFLAGASSEDVANKIKSLSADMQTLGQSLALIEKNNPELALNQGAAALQSVYDEYRQQFADLSDDLRYYTESGVGPAKAATESYVKTLTQQAQAEIEYQQALKNGNTEELNNKAELLRFEKVARDKQIASIKDQIATITNASGLSDIVKQGALKPLVDQLQVLQDESDQATFALSELGKQIPAVFTLEVLRRPIDAVKSLIESLTGINVDKAISDASDIQEKVKQRNQDISDAYSQYKDDIKNIEESSLKQRLSLQKKYSDALVDAAKQAVDAANQALENLKDQQAELAKDFARGERDVEKQARKAQLKEQIQIQREDRDALVAHLRDLETIRRNAQRQERDLIQNRDFAALFNLREDTANQIEDAQRAFNEGGADKIQQRAESRADELQAFAEERADRLAAYQERQADLQASYQQELAVIEQQRIQAINQAIADRNEGLRQEALDRRQQLKIRKSALDTELKLLADFGVEAGKIMARKLQEALNYLSSITPGGKGKAPVSIGGIKMRGAGGPLGAGDLSWVNDPIGNQESFNGVPFPPGLGLFMPAMGGNVTTNSKSMGNVSLSFNIQAARQPEATANAIERQVRIVLDKVLS